MIEVILQNTLDHANIPSQQTFQTWINKLFQHINNPIPKQVNEVCVRIVNPTESATLNKRFRRKQGPTNILSFPNTPNTPEHPDDTSLGDLVICAEQVASEAKSLDIPVENHWAHLTIHGILHLLGYDHIQEKDAIKMEALEIKILNLLNIENPYKDFFDDN